VVITVVWSIAPRWMLRLGFSVVAGDGDGMWESPWVGSLVVITVVGPRWMLRQGVSADGNGMSEWDIGQRVEVGSDIMCV